jgi:hypothetical protein
MRERGLIFVVAQTVSLLGRRLAICGRGTVRTRCRLPVGDTADCQSALRPKRPHRLPICFAALLVFSAIQLRAQALTDDQLSNIGFHQKLNAQITLDSNFATKTEGRFSSAIISDANRLCWCWVITVVQCFAR